MNSPNRPCDHGGAHDALFDQIERELAALTFAPLELAPLDTSAADPASRHCVDEFANEFLNWSMPPPHQGRARHSLR